MSSSCQATLLLRELHFLAQARFVRLKIVQPVRLGTAKYVFGALLALRVAKPLLSSTACLFWCARARNVVYIRNIVGHRSGERYVVEPNTCSG